MTESEVEATGAPAPTTGGWRRRALITAALVIPIVVTLLSPRRSAASTTPSGGDITRVVLANPVVPSESPALSIRYEAALPRGNPALLAQVQRTGLCALHMEFCKYRGLYRQVGFPFLVLCAIALPAWLVFRLYRLRTPGYPRSARREMLLLTAVVYLLCLATLTLTPNRSSRLRAEGAPEVELLPNPASLTCSSAGLSGAPNARMFCLQNAAGNVALFFPLGVLIPLIWSRLRFWRGVQIAIALSLGIELAQYLSRAWGSYRSADVNDVLLNTFGACLGLALVSLLRLGQGTRPAVRRA